MASEAVMPWRVFVSHTSELREFPAAGSFVAAVERAVAAAGHVAVDMADFPAVDEPPAEVCVERVRSCDVYVGVLGTRYGSPVRDRPDVSYTELEFEAATNAEIPRLLFLLDTDAVDIGIPPARLMDQQYGDRQTAFRQRVVDSGLTAQQFANPDQLQNLVERSLRALRDTRARIDSGLTRESQPSPAPPVRASKFVNPPPSTAPGWFQDRHVETGLIAEFLAADGLRMMSVIGRGGIGKTAMVCRLLKGLEAGRIPDVPDDLVALGVDGIVYLSPVGLHQVDFPNLYADLCRLLPGEVADRLAGLYRDAHNTPERLMFALLEAFPAGRVVVLLDNLESVMDSATEVVADTALDEALRALLRAPEHAVKVIVTTRVAPRELLRVEPARHRQIRLDEGLEHRRRRHTCSGRSMLTGRWACATPPTNCWAWPGNGPVGFLGRWRH